MDSWLNDLNEQQLEAVTATEGPLLILAGAGTGKTKTLTTRLVHILNKGLAKPSEVLCVTFTNKAAQEMESRITKLDKNISYLPWIGTFHSIAARFLRRHASLAGLESNFTILDKADSIKLLKNIQKNPTISQILYNYISKYKNFGMLPDDISQEEFNNDYNSIIFEYSDISFEDNLLYKSYSEYQKHLKDMNCCDFGDLLLLSFKILLANTEILSRYQENFKYIFVDEYQDTNLVQYLFIRLLAQKHQNICCVGDDDQAIYGWRGANVKHMLQFEHDFKNAKLIKLERNYRSTAPILGAANGVIKENTQRIGKNLYPHNEKAAQNIYVTAFASGMEEIQNICEQIINLQYQGHSLGEMAIIVRLRSQLNELESKLLNYQIKYRLIGESSFFESAEIKDIMAYLRIISQTSDNLAYERILNTPKRNLGKASLDKIKNYASTYNLPLYLAAIKCLEDNVFSKRQHNALQNFHGLLQKWRDFCQHMSIDSLTQEILNDIGYIDTLENDITGKRKLNIKSLLDQMQQSDIISLHEYLQNFALSSERSSKAEDAINIMTIHAAKGLEFKTVFSPAWEENILPFAKKGQIIENYTDIEEERRLAYVVMTRAKENLYLSFSLYRIRYGVAYYNNPSRFLDDIPAACTQVAK